MTKRATTWTPLDLPFATNYNDHFETPEQAYVDIKPVIDWICTSLNVDSCKSQVVSSSNTAESGTEISCLLNKRLRLYDPYYCNGRAATLLKQLGYENVLHAKRDFYLDIFNDSVPEHDVLITNPPFSDSHKTKCLNYCFRKLSKPVGTDNLRGNPFLLLMPTYVAAKQYYRELLTGPVDDVVYLIPSTSYKYDHPENTGKESCPFESLWFFGIQKDQIASFQAYWQSQCPTTNGLTLATSVAQLETMGIISTNNRPNPKQRSRMRKRLKKIVINEVSNDKPKINEQIDTGNDQTPAKKRKRRF